MKAGQFDRVVILLRPGAAIDDGYTTLADGFDDVGTRKARYQPARAREVFENAGREAKMPVLFTLRNDTLTRTINATWRLVFDGREFEITGVEELGRREGIRLTTVAGDEG